MRIGGRGWWSLPSRTTWLWPIFLCGVSGRCLGGTYDGFYYDVSGTNITIDGYVGSAQAVTVPSSIPGVEGTVTALDSGAFAQTPSPVTSVTIPDSVTRIGSDAFVGQSALSSVNLPRHLTSIGELTFSGCSSLASITIPDDVTNIGTAAFSGCRSLTSIAISSAISHIGLAAFEGCSGLTVFSVNPQNPFYSSLGGVLFNKDQTALVECPGGKDGAYAIPDGVTSVAEEAFYGCSNLTTLTMPDGLTNIGLAAFEWCTGLTNISIPNSVTRIQSSAFEGCTGLTSIHIPDDVTAIGDYTYKGCSGLTNISIGTGVTSIGVGAFRGCSRLISVALPNNVTNIGDYAFHQCSSLTSITIPGSVASLGESAFGVCSGLTNANFQGDAPTTFSGLVFQYAAPGFSIYYPSGASGWSTPTWHGYPAQPYNYARPPQNPRLALTVNSGMVTPAFSDLRPGTRYELQVSTDLRGWSGAGPAFTAASARETYPQPFSVTNSQRLFFRLHSAP